MKKTSLPQYIRVFVLSITNFSLTPFQHFFKRGLLKLCCSLLRHVVKICMKSGNEIWRLDDKLVLQHSSCFVLLQFLPEDGSALCPPDYDL